MTQVLIEARGLRKQYGSHVAVDGLDLKVRAGEVYGLLGPNGAGKTTTVEMLEGLRRPDAGIVRICGFDPVRQSRAVRERIGLCLQSTRMPDDMTGLEMLKLYASLYPNPVPIGDLLAQFQLDDSARKRIQTLSGGQRQRLALALALIGRPDVIFLDEPTAGLDPQSRRALWQVIEGLRADGRAIMLTTHYMDEAEHLCDRVGILDAGRLLAEGTPAELARQYGPERTIELDLDADRANLGELAQLDAVTGVRAENNQVILNTANTLTTLLSLAEYLRDREVPLGDLRTRAATLDDVFLALTGKGLRD